MRKVLLSLSLAVVCASLAPVDLTACGDKYIRLASRLGPAFVAEQRATILIYMPAGSAVPAAARKIGLHDSLKQAGHRVETIGSAADLDAALRARRYDIVIADAAAAGEIEPRLQRATGQPTLVPVFHTVSQRELATAREQKRCLIASRERAYHAVAEIEHVMQLRKTLSATP